MKKHLHFLLYLLITGTVYAQDHVVTVQKGTTTLDISSNSPGTALNINRTDSGSFSGPALNIINDSRGTGVRVRSSMGGIAGSFTSSNGGFAVEGHSFDQENMFFNVGGLFSSTGSAGNGVRGEVFTSGATQVIDPSTGQGYGGYFFSDGASSGGVFGEGFNGVYGRSLLSNGHGGYFIAEGSNSKGVFASGTLGIDAQGSSIGIRATGATAGIFEGTVFVAGPSFLNGDLSIGPSAALPAFKVDLSERKVGIGTSSPERELHVHDTNNNGDAIAEFSSSSGDLIIGMNISSGGVLGTTTNKPLRIRTNNSNRMVISSTGNIGIGQFSPNARLDVTGSIEYTGSLTDVSDERFKKDINTIENSLKRVLQLRGVTYYFRQDEFPEMEFEDSRQIGFIAQELEPLFPELVKTDPDGYKSVDYVSMTAVLVQAMNEQQVVIQQLRSENSKLHDEFKDLEAAVDERLAKLESQ